MIENLFRAIGTTRKQIKRSGWLALASISVMTLAFFITSVFGILAYTSNLFLQSVEQEPQIYAFFEIGTEEGEILGVQEEWESLEGVAYVDYTSEDQAKQEFYSAQSEINELAADAVEERSLPASLAIRLYSLEDAPEISEIISDAQSERSEIKDIYYSRDIVDNIREVFMWLRFGGGTVMVLLVVVLVLFTLLTIEFRMHSRSEEIGIMQLVGGSLFYIRLPFILEGAFYGIIGALISNIILSGLFALFNYQINSNDLVFVKEILLRLDWPDLGIPEITAMFAGTMLLGALLGSINSFIAIKGYIK
jgi:cell division transport system permease protein